ncbi:hypothetical protein [Lactococcus garvieae]|uniref:hypothetical protein n=1 Tax=Lactococcus garvieae TaxID=1363 RepID=UPI0002EEB8C8|nr:hypothetical protein [Lactococcus garvieae]
MKYKKKPVVIEAVEFIGFEGDNFSERPEWLIKAIYEDKVVKFFDKKDTLTIETLEGPIYASIGDYIIRGVQGEIYPCKPEIFKETYEVVE